MANLIHNKRLFMLEQDQFGDPSNLAWQSSSRIGHIEPVAYVLEGPLNSSTARRLKMS